MVILGLGLGLLILGLSYGLVDQEEGKGEERRSSYECGFECMGDAREVVEVRFYVVGMMFILFDVEASYVIPWVVGGMKGYMYMGDFMVELGLGIGYVYRMGVLDWDSEEGEGMKEG